jgi:arabinan endo-1,5-alpha-L-arabinosidase
VCSSSRSIAFCLPLLLFAVTACATVTQNQAAVPAQAANYTNPLTLNTASGPAVSCPDPALIKQRAAGRDSWYLYCTGDPLNSSDVNAAGYLNAHLITQYQSYDLVHGPTSAMHFSRRHRGWERRRTSFGRRR